MSTDDPTARLREIAAEIGRLQAELVRWKIAVNRHCCKIDPIETPEQFEALDAERMKLIRSESDAAAAEIERLRAIIDYLPKTADGAPAWNGMPVWCVMPDYSVYKTEVCWHSQRGGSAREMLAVSAGYRLPNRIWRGVSRPVEKCYSTEAAAYEAALAAKEKSNG